LAAFLILAVAAAAVTAITISSAQSRKKARAKAQTSSAKRQASSKLTPAERLFKAERGGTGRAVQGESGQENEGRERTAAPVDQKQRKAAFANLKPKETRLNRAKPFNGDLRSLPYIPPVKKEKPEREPPRVVPVPYGQSGTTSTKNSAAASPAQEGSAPELSAPAPAPLSTFIGLDFTNWGAGRPPDTVGDVGPTYFIQSVNSSVGIYQKSDGVRVAAFTLDTLMSQGNFGNICDTENFGDPVILYDSFEDRWIISDFAFQLDAQQNVSPQVALQCTAVSKTGDPVSGGWNFYYINTTGGLGDYPKFGVWPDGIYMSTNMYGYAATAGFNNARLYAFNKAQMYAGSPTVQTVQFDLPSSEFALLPSNARLQTGTPPAGSPNYLTEVWNFLNVVSVYKFHVDWNSISLSTLTGPFDSTSATWWAQFDRSGTGAFDETAPTLSQANDTLYPRVMMQNQYSNIGGVESLWNSQTAGAGNPTTNVTSTQAAVRYYQLNVTGGTVAASTVQNFTYSPDATIYRYMPSSAVDRAGNMAIGYSTSNAATHPGIKYAGRLSTDAVNTISQTEQTMFQGTGSQNTSNRWGDYAAMTLDPDGCTFWFTSEYYAVTGGNWQTRIGSFKFAQCTPVGGGGAVSGTVTANPGGAPLQGATVTLGSRSTTTDASGNYSFSVPAGTYPGMTAAFPGRTGASAASIPVTDGNITTRNFSLSAAATSACLTDTTQADFQLGIPTNTDLTTNAGDVKLSAPIVIDRQTTNYTSNGFGFSNTSIAGETFTPTATGTLQKIDVNLFCSGCSGTNPNIIVEVRTTSAGNIVMTAGGLLASATIPGTSSASGGFMTATFTTPPTLTGGTVYGFIIKLAAARTTGTQAYLVSDGDGVAGGRRQTCSTSACANATGASNDIVFKAYLNKGFTTSGDLISSLKDANPAAGNTANWGTFSWTATTPASTAVKFQVAASNNVNGPFSYVGTDGTASTFYTTSGGSLAQFNGKRYLRYKALLTGISSATPTLNDVTVCFTDVASILTTSLAASSATGTFGGTVNLSATLTASATGVSGKSIAFTLNGNSVGSATTNGSGVATLSSVSLAGINAGSYPTGVGASFAGDSGYTASSGTASLTVNKAGQTITFGALSDKTYGDADFSVSASASSGLSVSFGASGNCTVSGSTVHLTGAGSCTITASQAGNTNYNAATNVPQSFNISKAATTTAVTVSNATYDGNPHGGSASVSGPAGLSQSLTVSYSGRNSTTYGPTTTAPTSAGDYTASASFAGDLNYQASSDSKDYQITKANQTINFAALGDKTYGDADFNVSATASSGLAVSFAASGNCTVTGTSVHLTGAGSCTITAAQGGNSNYNAASDVPRAFSIAKATATVSLSNLSHTYDGSPKSASVSTTPNGLSVTVTYDGSATAPTNAGDYAVVATVTDSNYQGSASDTLTISKANQTITFGALSDKTYGDPDFNVSASASSSLPVGFAASGDCSVTGTSVHITGAGSCTITASQPGDSNYNAAANVPQSFNIAKASATVSLSNLSQTYDGTAKSASASTNPNGLNVVITYGTGSSAHRRNTASLTPIDAGSYSVTATIDDPNYEGSATDTLVISKADATISVTGYTGAYDGSAHGATGSATGAQSEDLSSLLHLGSSYTNVPGGTANWTFDGNNNYNSDSGSVSIDISKATPTINWSNPADIVYGTALSATQLNASASTAGAYTYTPAAGTVLSSGNGQNLHVAFVPTDTANYNNASADVSINVLSAVLSTSMIADRNPALVGYNHNYKVSIANTGNAPAANLSLTDVLPTKVTFTAVSTSQGSCTYAAATRTVTCNLGTLPAGSTANVQITVKPREEGTLDDTATIAAAQWDPATGNSSASVNGLQSIAQVDVSVSKVDSADPIFVGDQTTYTLTVKNQNTPINATGITLTDSLPSSMTFVSASTSQGTLVTPPVDSTGIVTANLGSLAPNATATVMVTVKGTAAGAFTNTATVTENETDTNNLNNSASQSTTVKPVVVVTVTLQKVLLASQVLTGGCQNTTGNVYLTAPAPAGGVTVNLSSNVSGASVPASVFILAGQMVSPAFNVTTSAVTAKQVGLITATYGASSVSRGITINVGSGTCP
jgi:uncharacterized repeat protein (TIGR01451 family)